jgi:hypothetical protein
LSFILNLINKIINHENRKICYLPPLWAANAGLDKFLQYMPMPKITPEQMKIFDAFNKLHWLMPFVGAVEKLADCYLSSQKQEP